MTKWSIELLNFKVFFETRKAIKVHLLADLWMEMTPNPPESAHAWTTFTGESSNSRGTSVGMVLENGYNLIVDFSL